MQILIHFMLSVLSDMVMKSPILSIKKSSEASPSAIRNAKSSHLA